MSRSLVLLICLGAVGCASTPAKRFDATVRRLAAPEMKGRAMGSVQLREAESWLMDQFQQAGLKPYGRSQLQEVTTTLKKGGKVTSHNVVGAAGDGCRKSKSPVVIGAHLDHLGMFGDAPYPGADDNASGIAALLETAREIHDTLSDKGTNRGLVSQACFVFVAFTGEETGLHGSKAFFKALSKARIRPSSMINLDMVGRLKNNELYIFGQRSLGEDAALIADLCKGARLKCLDGAIDTVMSDHLVFNAEKIPTLHFFTGAHADKHKASDTADKIDSEGGARVAWLAAQVALATAKSVK